MAQREQNADLPLAKHVDGAPGARAVVHRLQGAGVKWMREWETDSERERARERQEKRMSTGSS